MCHIPATEYGQLTSFFRLHVNGYNLVSIRCIMCYKTLIFESVAMLLCSW